MASIPPQFQNLSPSQLAELSKFFNDRVTQTTLYLFTLNHVLYFLLLYLSSKVLEVILKRLYPRLSKIHLKNCVTYVLEIVVTIIALVLLICSYNFFEKNWYFNDTRMLQVASLLVVDLYIFELLYRPMMRLPLIIHHFATIGAAMFGYYVINSTMDLICGPAGIGLLFQATTEQTTFLGLLFYRLKPSWAKPVLKFSAFQVFITKMGALIWCFVMWKRDTLSKHDPQLVVVWNVIFPIVCIILFATQIWSTYVVWQISAKSRRNVSANVRKFDSLSDIEQGEQSDNNFDSPMGVLGASMVIGGSMVTVVESRTNNEIIEKNSIESSEEEYR